MNGITNNNALLIAQSQYRKIRIGCAVALSLSLLSLIPIIMGIIYAQPHVMIGGTIAWFINIPITLFLLNQIDNKYKKIQKLQSKSNDVNSL